MLIILPMLSYSGCHERIVHWLYWNSHTWSSIDVKVTSSCDIASQFLNRKAMVSKKKNTLFV